MAVVLVDVAVRAGTHRLSRLLSDAVGRTRLKGLSEFPITAAPLEAASHASKPSAASSLRLNAPFFSLAKERPPIGRISFGWLLARLAVTVSNRKLLSAIASAHYAFIK
jgi:hypothetical protein